MSYDISPDPQALIRAIQSETWPVAKMLAELIDNSLAQDVGEATLVRIEYNRKDRIMSILDNGRGMENVGLLFKIGGHLAGPRSINEYGYGGTKAIMSLGKRVLVTTMRKGKYARVFLTWKDVKTLPHFIDDEWRPATATQVPGDLLEMRHGTFVQLALPPKRQIHGNNIRRDLAAEFAPGLRKGLRIEWVDENGTTELAAPPLPPDTMKLKVEFEHEGVILKAKGGASYTPGLSRDQSGISIGFWARTILPNSRAPFRDADGNRIDGTGVSGYLELSPGWQPFLTSTKQGFDDDQARQLLMDSLAEQLQPLLKQVEASYLDIVCEDLALEMAAAFDSKLGATLETPLDPEGELVPDPEGDERMPGHTKTESGGGTGTPASRHAGQRKRFEVIRQTDDQMEQKLFDVDIDVRPDAVSILGYINQDHPTTQLALKMDPPNRALMLYGVVRDLAPAIWELDPHARTRFLTHDLVKEVEGLDESKQVPHLVRLLMDRVT